MPTQRFVVKGLPRENEAEVAKRLRAMDGVFGALVEDEMAEVDFEDDRASIDEMRALLRAMGYDAEVAG